MAVSDLVILELGDKRG